MYFRFYSILSDRLDFRSVFPHKMLFFFGCKEIARVSPGIKSTLGISAFAVVSLSFLFRLRFLFVKSNIESVHAVVLLLELCNYDA